RDAARRIGLFKISCAPRGVTPQRLPANMGDTNLGGPDVVAIDCCAGISRRPCPVERGRGGASGRGRAVHLAGVLVLSAGQRLPERNGARPPRRAAARVSRHLLGPTGLEGPVLADRGDRAPGPLRAPFRRRILYP